MRDLDRALAFYRVFGFALLRRAEGDDVAIIRNGPRVELNLVFNANAGDPAVSVLIDAPQKFPGYTHIALRVGSIPATIAALQAEQNGIAITPGPVSFGQRRARLGVRARSRPQRHRAARPQTQALWTAPPDTCRNTRKPFIHLQFWMERPRAKGYAADLYRGCIAARRTFEGVASVLACFSRMRSAPLRICCRF